MRVGINGLFWSQVRTGSGQYTRQLWHGLHRLTAATDHEFRLLMPDNPAETAETQSLVLPTPKNVARGGDNIGKVWWEQRGIPQLANVETEANRPFDLVHYPYFAAPLVKPKSPTAVVVTIHDLIPLALPEYAGSRAAKAYFRLVSAAAKRADLIFADSEHSKQDILRFLKIPASKVAVIYLGTDEQYKPAHVSPPQKQALLRKYGLQGQERVIFYIGGFDVRKNVPLLLRSFGAALPRLKDLEGQDGKGAWTLVLAGKPHTNNPAMYPELDSVKKQAVGTGEDSRRIHFTGAISEEDKLLFYQIADMFVFPSRYEGFGLDPLDALATAVPTICSNATCLPEVMGEAALLVPPSNVQAWAEAVINLAGDENLRAELLKRAPAQAAKFTWAKTAKRTLELYHMFECINSLHG
jgi:glycosyltransferase involved in cell wall biosynthesis